MQRKRALGAMKRRSASIALQNIPAILAYAEMAGHSFLVSHPSYRITAGDIVALSIRVCHAEHCLAAADGSEAAIVMRKIVPPLPRQAPRCMEALSHSILSFFPG